ncbi:MAG: sodium/solute symporter [Nitrospiraceae bacterium]|nr:sodium/solute symporter [Nitrospiraceae bacterium]
MRILDIIVLVVYFGAMASMGPLFARRNRTTEGYFLGNRSFPGWLVGFSMFATSISSITFMAYPADAFKTSWLRMVPNFALPIGVLIASRFFLPFFRRGKITSAYEYLEDRFGPNVRLYAASAFIVAQIIRISMVLFLVSQLVEELTGLSAFYSVLLGGIVTSFYTITGGIRAVLWTDFIQAIVLWVGGVVCVLVIAIQLGGPFEGLAEIVRVGMEHSKFAFAEYMADTGELRPVGWGISLTEKTVLLMFLLGLGDWLAEYSSNQNVVQRYCACKSTKDARIAMWICCWFSVPTWALFMFLGTALFAFYQAAPTVASDAMLSGAEKAEGILPYFVLNNLPVGVAGLVIAAVLSAAMSSISSSINGVSAVGVVDIYRRRIVKGRDDRHYVKVAKLIGVAEAVLMIVGAIILVKVEGKTLQDTARVLTALTAGGLLGLYLLGFMTCTANGKAVGVGIVCTLLFTAWVALTSMKWLPEGLWCPLESYYAGMVGHAICFGVGFVLGKIVFRNDRDLKNLSVWTQDGLPLD